MPVDVTCTTCQRKMRVPDTALGKRIKCPKCQAVIDVPGMSASAVMNVPVGVPVEMWHLKTEDGQMYGPISRHDLDTWYSEGRLTQNSQVLRVGADQWQWASDLYPSLVPQQAPAQAYAPAPSYMPAPTEQFNFGGAPQAYAPSAPENPFDFTGSGSSSGGVSSVRSRSSMSTSSSTKMSDKSKVVAGLLGIFLGAYGIHNFYLGNTNKAILQLILLIPTCGLSGMWGAIEGIMILMGSINRDARGRRLRD